MSMDIAIPTALPGGRAHCQSVRVLGAIQASVRKPRSTKAVAISMTLFKPSWVRAKCERILECAALYLIGEQKVAHGGQYALGLVRTNEP